MIFTFKTKLAIFILQIAFISSASAEKLKPFSDWIKETQGWQNDKSEIAYALTRCGTLYSTIGVYFIANSTKNEDKLNGENLVKKGRELNTTGIQLSMSNGMSIDAATNRNKKLFEIYVDDVKSNKAINNNVFYGNTGKDFEFCLQLYEMFNIKK
jgi:hypothetical protein